MKIPRKIDFDRYFLAIYMVKILIGCYKFAGMNLFLAGGLEIICRAPILRSGRHIEGRAACTK